MSDKKKTRKIKTYCNTTLVFTDFIYLAPNGNDKTGDGSYDKPYKTIKHSISKVDNNNTAIVFKEGKYNENPYSLSEISGNLCNGVANDYYVTNKGTHDTRYYYCQDNKDKKALFYNQNYKITFIGENNNVEIYSRFNEEYSTLIYQGKQNTMEFYGLKFFVDCNTSYYCDNNIFISTCMNGQLVNIYNCVFKYIKNYNNIRGIFESGDSSASSIKAYNCIFDLGDVYNAFSGTRHRTYKKRTEWYGSTYNDNQTNYDNNELQNVKSKLIAINCIFKNIDNWGDCNGYENGAFIECSNCIIPNLPSYGNAKIDKYSLKSDVNFDNDFYPGNSDIWINTGVDSIKDPDNKISSIGVYGGPYSWEPKVRYNAANIMMESFLKQIDKNKSNEFKFTIQPHKNFNYIHSEEMFNGEYIETNNIKYDYLLDKREWDSTQYIELL